jgi:hypothetical protein
VIFDYDHRRNQLTVIDNGGYETRTKSTVHLLVEAATRARLTTSVRIPVFTDDFVPSEVRERCFGYCTGPGAKNVIPIPDFIFWAWPEVGIADYDSIATAMIAASAMVPEDDRLFWIGNPNTNSSRVTFLNLAAQYPDLMLGVGMGWQPDGESAGEPLEAVGQYVSLPDHCKYRFLIDLQARGYSGRTKLLLFSGRPLFLQERVWREYFYSDITPFVHYIPVKADLSDLIERIQWARANPAEVQAIAKNAQVYATKNLWRSNAVDHLARCLQDWGPSAS